MWDFFKYAGRMAIEDTDRSVTYDEVGNFCRNFTVRYDFFKKNNRTLTLIITDNSINCIMTYAACVENRIPVLLVNENLTEDILAGIVCKYEPSVIFDFSGKICKTDYFVVREKQKYSIHPDLALLLLTSGSTGNSKAVRLSYENLYSNMKSISESLDIVSSDRAALMLPMSYSYGLSVINSNFYSGAAIIKSLKITDPGLAKYLAGKKVTSVCGVPLTYRFLKKIKFNFRKIINLRLITQAGGALDSETKMWLCESSGKSTDIAVMYGQTEATARMTCFYLNRHPEKKDSAGQAIPGGKIEISEAGEIFYYGRNVFMGYADSCKDLKKGSENGLCLRTGDLGYKDEDGYVYITGRKSRFAKVSGIRVNLQDIERIVTDEFHVDAAAVSYNDRVYVFYVPLMNEKSEFTKEAEKSILMYLVKWTGLSGFNFSIEKTDSIPVGSNGKVDYAKLKEKQKA